MLNRCVCAHTYILGTHGQAYILAPQQHHDGILKLALGHIALVWLRAHAVQYCTEHEMIGLLLPVHFV